ncbi:hypothetical protein [Falsiroseomonas sp. HW251]|uniref:hypothetical protein n=1 Tax=Falsiroseomonas sp. HW251 TaxID=3390998 RepID=UPI003D31B666
MRAITAMATLGVAMLAGCAPQQTGPALPMGAAPPGFQCPAAGTQIVGSDGTVTQFTGVSPSDPFACTMNTNSGPQTRLANIYPLPVPEEAALRNGMARLWPLEPGKSTNFIREISGQAGALGWINETWHVLGQQTLVVANQPRQVMVMENIQSMPYIQGYAGQWTLYYDIQARAFVGGDLRVIRGINNTPSWRATSITTPGS